MRDARLEYVDAEVADSRVASAARRAFHPLVDRIRQDIFQRRSRPGDRLPREQALAEQFGISRAAVREAIRGLEMQGLVRVRHGYRGGVFVAEPGTRPLLRALDTSLRLEDVHVDELYEVRRLVEPALARVALERDPASIAQILEANVARAEARLAAGEKPIDVNVEFHAILARAGGNRVLSLVMQVILELVVEGREHEPPADVNLSSQAVDDHRQILQAIKADDGRLVEALMLAHLTRVHERPAPEHDVSDLAHGKDGACSNE
jgi:GntR family transcriptional repressor for pyruvate dehydrogenase complex